MSQPSRPSQPSQPTQDEHPTTSATQARRSSLAARRAAFSPSLAALLHGARLWIIDHLSIRLRQVLWSTTLVTLIFLLSSVVVYTVEQNQLQNNLMTDIRGRAIAIASALQNEQGATQGNGGSNVLPTPSPTVPVTATPDKHTTTSPQATPNATTSPQATAQPTGTVGASQTTTPGSSSTGTPGATGTPGTGTGTPGVSSTPTPASTPDPRTSAIIQNRLLTVPNILGQLDLGFEVLDTTGRLKYRSPSLSVPGLPIDLPVVNAAFHGVPGSYVRQSGSLLEIYVQPIIVAQPTAAEQTAAAFATPTPIASTTAGSRASSPVANSVPIGNGQEVIGLVLVAKPLDEVNNSLATLSHILLVVDLIGIILAALFAWFIAESGLRPITRVTRAARAIAINAHAAGLGTRVRYRGPRDEVGELVSTFNDMLASLEQVTNAQRRFIADASHELRAPLTTIKGSLDFLRRAHDLPEEERTAMLEDAYAESERMATLVSDLLLLARVDASASARGVRATLLDEQLTGRREPVELDQLAMEVFRYGRAQLRARHKDISLSVTNLEPVTVLADPGQLRQLALILLDNAIKYNPPGGKIRLAVTRNGARAAFSVSDTGMGIDPADRPHIFERFYRSEHAREHDENGSGLGLAIAKWIVEAHGGEITLNSQPGQGSTFTALLPAVRRVGDQPTGTPAHATRATQTTQTTRATSEQRRRGASASLRNPAAPKETAPQNAEDASLNPLERLTKTISHPRSNPINTAPKKRKKPD